MTRNQDVEKGLQQLLKDRRIPVDEDRLEAMRESLLRQVPHRTPRRLPVFFRQYGYSLSFGTALVLVALIVWQIIPLGPGNPPSSPGLMEIAADEGRVDRALVLLNGFASVASQGETMVDWEYYNRSMVGDYGDENILETFYGSI
jgi:hypothetical protein